MRDKNEVPVSEDGVLCHANRIFLTSCIVFFTQQSYKTLYGIFIPAATYNPETPWEGCEASKYKMLLC